MKTVCTLREAKAKLEQYMNKNDHIQIKVWKAIVRKLENEEKPPVQSNKARKKSK